MKVDINQTETTEGNIVERKTAIVVLDYGKFGPVLDILLPVLKGTDAILRSLWARWQRQDAAVAKPEPSPAPAPPQVPVEAPPVSETAVEAPEASGQTTLLGM